MTAIGKLLYFIGKTFFAFFFFVFYQPEILNKQNISREEGPVIIMANHQSYLDPPLVGTVFPRQVFFLAKKSLFKNALFGWILKKIGVIPIKRGKPDLGALKRTFRILSAGKCLGIFPEGTRIKEQEIGEIQPGAVLIALKTQAPIIPVGIKNITLKGKTTISIGKPFKLDNYYDRKLNSREKKEVAEIIRSKIKQELKADSN